MSDATRDEILRLRRRGARTPLPLAIALLVALALSVVAGDEIGVLWAILLVLGVPGWLVIVRSARVRDAIVLGKGEVAAREYLRGRLATQVARSARVAGVPAISGVLLVFIGLILLVGGRRHPAQPMSAAQNFVVGFTVLGTSLWRWPFTWFSMRRRLAALGGPPDAPGQKTWLIDAAREVAATQSDTHAAVLWHEATGARMRDANTAVRNLPELTPEPPDAATAAGPPIDSVRAWIKALGRSDLVGNTINLAMLAALVALQNSVHGVAADVFWRETFPELTVAQQIYVCLGILTIVGLFAVWSLHRDALKGNETSMRRYLRRSVDRRIEHILGSSRASRFVVVLAAGIVVVAAADAGFAYARGKPPLWPILAEAGLLLVWMVVRPRLTRRRRLHALERMRAELGGPLVAESNR